MKTLLVCNDPPYATGQSWNGLRMAGALGRRDGKEVRVFLLGDAVGCAADDGQSRSRPAATAGASSPP